MCKSKGIKTHTTLIFIAVVFGTLQNIYDPSISMMNIFGKIVESF